LTHLHGLILKGGQPFWVPQPDLCPSQKFQRLTPKIPCAILPNFAVFDIVGRKQILKKSKYENLRK
jgi:hypothetical protein